MATKKVTPAAKPGTAVAVKGGSSVISIQAALQAQVAALSEKTAPAGGNYIRLSPGKFTLPDGTTTPGPLELVIVEFASANKFWPGNYDPKNIESPVCFALGTNPLKMVPSNNSPEKQSDDCQSCPNNQYGSAGDGKACKNSRVLAVLPPDADADTPMWLLATSPTANKGFDGYVAGVARTFQMPPIGVVTSVSLDPSTTYAKLVFGNPAVNEHLDVHFARQEEARAMLAIEPEVSAAKPAKAGKKVPARR